MITSTATDAAFAAVDRQRAWERYWRTGVLHSCPTSYAGNYEGAIGDFWQQAAHGLPRDGRIIDLASGNLAIPRFLIDAGRVDLEMVAVDAAALSIPAQYVPACVRLQAGVWMEDLPFPAACFDAVCSQFGIEYARHPEAWEEVVRVLKPGGQIHAVIHYRESVFARVATHECEHLDWAVGPQGLLQASLVLAPWLRHVRAGHVADVPEVAHVARQAFNQVQVELEDRIQCGQAVDVLHEIRTHVHELLLQPQDPVAALEDYRQALADARLRCAELVACARDEVQMQMLSQWISQKRPDLQVQLVALSQRQGVLAWGLRALPLQG